MTHDTDNSHQSKSIDDYLTLKEASQLPECNVQAGSLRSAAWRGALPAKKPGNTWLVHKNDLFLYLETRRVGRPPHKK